MLLDALDKQNSEDLGLKMASGGTTVVQIALAKDHLNILDMALKHSLFKR